MNYMVEPSWRGASGGALGVRTAGTISGVDLVNCGRALGAILVEVADVFAEVGRAAGDLLASAFMPADDAVP